jgi:TIR domain
MTQVFTSYSRRDKESVDQIVGVIEGTGIDVWIDREDIKAGNMWRVQIVEAIDTCAAFLLMLSPNSTASDNVRKEIDLAEGSERPIFAVMLQPVKLPADIRYQLAGLQIIDVQRLGFEEAVARLIEHLKEHIKKIAAAAQQSVRQVELVIQGIDLSAFGPEKQEQLLAFIANLANTDRSQVKLESMAAGSVYVFINVPASAAFELKTLALNRDKRLQQFGITSLRLDGDKKFINVSLGKPMLAATIGPLAALWLKVPALFAPVLGATAGKVLTVLLITTVIAGAGILVPATFAPAPTPTPTSIPTSLLTFTPIPASSDTPLQTATQTPNPTSTLTETMTATQTLTSTVTPSPVPTYLTLTGVIANPLSNLVACRYGPGDIYLYRFGPQNGIQMSISGKAEIHTLREVQTWLWGLPNGYSDPCWVNAKYVRLNGDLTNLEPVYPEKVDIPFIRNPRWPVPQNVKVSRLGDEVTINWDAYVLPLGERGNANAQSPQYILELWLCQGGRVAFTPIGNFDSPASGGELELHGIDELRVTDEAGCAEPSHGRIFLVEVHGYVGPVEIPWPPNATPTP